MTALRRLALATAIGAAVAGSIYATRAHSQSPLELLQRADQAETARPDGKSRTVKGSRARPVVVSVRDIKGIKVPAPIRGRLVCGDNASNVARVNGYSIPHTRRARDFLRFGRAVSGPGRFGFLITERNDPGGDAHVEVTLPSGQCLNFSQRQQRFVVRQCPSRRVLGWRAL